MMSGKWDAKTPDEEKIIAMAIELKDLKLKLKLKTLEVAASMRGNKAEKRQQSNESNRSGHCAKGGKKNKNHTKDCKR